MSESEFTELKNFQNVCFWQGLVCFYSVNYKILEILIKFLQWFDRL